MKNGNSKYWEKSSSGPFECAPVFDANSLIPLVLARLIDRTPSSCMASCSDQFKSDKSNGRKIKIYQN
ncbi:hypothetical protein WDW37_09195, partial [Bdellovibrionota bacterium FG-1]